MAHRSDAQLIQECRDGSQTAWNQLIDRYGRLVYSIPRRYGLSEADADDVFALVWATVFRKLDDLRDQTRMSAWLITSTHRESWRVGRGRSRSHADLHEQIADINAPSDEQLTQWEQQHLIREALEQLGGRCRDLLTALFLDTGECSYVQIAERLGMTVGSIGPTRARCFKKLEAILIDLGIEPMASDSPAAAERG